ncbi:MAG: TapB family protein [Candidatus Binatia bacterium]
MHLQRVVMLVLGAVVAGAGCGAPTRWFASSRNSPEEFFPLRTGSFWVYRVRDPWGEESLQRVLVRGPRYLENKRTTGMLVEESGGLGGEFALDPSWHPIAYYRDGDYVYKYYGITRADAELREMRLGCSDEKLLPAGPREDEEWESEVQLFDLPNGAGYGMRVVSRATSTEESVTVPAGRFDGCLLVDTTIVPRTHTAKSTDEALAFFHYRDWYAPGVGLVKSLAISGPKSEPMTTIELLSFRDGIESR